MSEDDDAPAAGSMRRVATSVPPSERGLFVGIPASPGVAVGRAIVYDRKSVPIHRQSIRPDEVENEVTRLMRALIRSRQLIEEARDALDPEASAEHRLMLEAHLLMHRDELLVSAAIESIRSRMNAEWAVRRAVESLVRKFSLADEPYLRDRAHDVEQVGENVLAALTGRSAQMPVIEHPSVLVAHDLSPAEAAKLPRGLVRGLVTDLGTASSHTAILARALGIPAVVGVQNITRSLNPGDCVVVDALGGLVIISPDDEERARAEERGERYRIFTSRLRNQDASSTTRDGFPVELMANVELEIEVEEAELQRADGIGLYRTEFLYLDEQLPSEEHQYELYARIASRLSPRPVTLRTFDLGADKMRRDRMFRSPNPALGLRGLRLALACPDIFRVQLRAMMRAAYVAPIRAMLPMVCTIDELRAAKKLLREAREELERDQIPHRAIELGAMIEVPSAVMIADLLATECAFFSIGTNDLVQYAFAADRQNPRVSSMASPLEPALLRMLASSLDAARSASISISVCGDLSANPLVLPLLIGLGYRSFSMPASALPIVREIVQRLEHQACADLMKECAVLRTASEIRSRVIERLEPLLGDIWAEQELRPPSFEDFTVLGRSL